MRKILCTRHGSLRAFSLIELLVVIGIVALLASLLLPALSRAKASARAAACRNNLRQVNLTLAMYVGDFAAYPPAMGVFPLSQTRFGGNFYPLAWHTALAAHSDVDWSIYRCPQDAKYRSVNLEVTGSGIIFGGGKDVIGRITYGYNASGTAEFGTGSKLGLGELLTEDLVVREQSIRSPATMIALGDGMGNLVLSPVSSERHPASRHNQKANILFCDGHIEASKPAHWIGTNDSQRSRWNNDGQPHSMQ